MQQLLLSGALDAGRKLLGKGTEAELLQRLFVFNEDTSAELDALCGRESLQNDLQSSPSPKVQLMAWIRCMHALDFVGALMEPDQTGVLPFCDSAAISQERLLRWMLVGLWARRYDHWLQQVARKMSGAGDIYPKPEGLF